jgi:alpha-ketoglutarate-dependent taurine dioxygenase
MRYIETINSYEFSSNESLIDGIQQKFGKSDSIILHMPSVEESTILLFKLMDILGTVSLEDITAPDFETSVCLHRVEASKDNIKGRYGFQPSSTTNCAIPCHTEDYFIPNPSDIMMLQCVRQDRDGGQSIVAFLEDILSELDFKVLQLLHQCAYPSYFGKVAILEHDDYGRPKIRYNRATLKKSLIINNLPFPQEYEEALDVLDGAIEKSQMYFHLRSGDIWIVNNKKVLHGRKALSMGTNRLLKRVKLYSENPMLSNNYLL